MASEKKSISTTDDQYQQQLQDGMDADRGYRQPNADDSRRFVSAYDVGPNARLDAAGSDYSVLKDGRVIAGNKEWSKGVLSWREGGAKSLSNGALAKSYEMNVVSDDPLLAYIRDNGQVTFSVDGRIGVGFSASLSLSKSGVSYYFGRGDGKGLNVSAIYELAIGKESLGIVHSETYATGRLFGGRYSAVFGNNGLQHLTGLGWSVGSGWSRTTGYSEYYYKWEGR